MIQKFTEIKAGGLCGGPGPADFTSVQGLPPSQRELFQFHFPSADNGTLWYRPQHQGLLCVQCHLPQEPIQMLSTRANEVTLTSPSIFCAIL